MGTGAMGSEENEDGQRTVLMVFDLTDPLPIPVLTEPMYQQGKATVTLTPCMNLEDLEKGFEELASQMAATEGKAVCPEMIMP
jgi:hypothetical protein